MPSYALMMGMIFPYIFHWYQYKCLNYVLKIVRLAELTLEVKGDCDLVNAQCPPIELTWDDTLVDKSSHFKVPVSSLKPHRVAGGHVNSVGGHWASTRSRSSFTSRVKFQPQPPSHWHIILHLTKIWCFSGQVFLYQFRNVDSLPHPTHLWCHLWSHHWQLPCWRLLS